MSENGNSVSENGKPTLTVRLTAGDRTVQVDWRLDAADTGWRRRLADVGPVQFAADLKTLLEACPWPSA